MGMSLFNSSRLLCHQRVALLATLTAWSELAAKARNSREIVALTARAAK